MKCILLCAGYGTRLYPLTKDTAKPLLPVRGKPIVEFILDKVSCLDNADKVYVVTNHRFYDQFVRWQKTCNCRIPVEIIDDGSLNNKDRLGSIGDLRLVIEQKQIHDDIMVIGGDNIFSFDLDLFKDKAVNAQDSSYIGVYNLNGRMEANKYGVVSLTDTGEVSSFKEKPKIIDKSHLVSMCLYYFSREKLPLLERFVNESRDHDRFGDFIQWLVANDKVSGHEFFGDWYDIGDIDSYTEAICTF